MTSSKQESLEELVVRKVQEYLAKHPENPWKKDNEKELAFRRLQEDMMTIRMDRDSWKQCTIDVKNANGRLEEELKQTRDARDTLRTDRDVYKGHADKLQYELVHARDLLTEQGGMLARLKDQVAALQEHASRVYWLGQENGFSQARDLLNQDGININQMAKFDEWQSQALDNAEKKRPMPTITKAVETDRMEREARPIEVVESFPCPRCGAGLYDSTQIPSGYQFTCGWCHTLVEAPAGRCSSSASTAAKKTDSETIPLESAEEVRKSEEDRLPSLAMFDDPNEKAGFSSARKDLLAVRHEVDVLRDERDFLTWSAARLAKIVKEFWFALSFEETCHPRGLSSDVARDRLVVLSHKPMRRDSDGRLIINWKNVLDPAHYGGTVSDGMKSWLNELWMTT